MALSVYLFNPADTPLKNDLQSHEIHIEVPEAPQAPAPPTSVTVDIKNLEQLEKLKELKHVEQELKKVEKELEKVSIQLDMEIPSLSGLQNLPEILIHSN